MNIDGQAVRILHLNTVQGPQVDFFFIQDGSGIHAFTRGDLTRTSVDVNGDGARLGDQRGQAGTRIGTVDGKNGFCRISAQV